jgi:DNA repair photolyase
MEILTARSIFSPATGYIRRAGFDWSCNPYLGCSFGCTYCYAMFLPQNRRPREHWGRWFQAKANAIELTRRQAPKVAGQCIYLSTVTDPYLPAERALQLTRGILKELLPFQPRLLIQTRGPLVVRDVDILSRFRAVRVNFSIPTDSEEVRKVFEPKAPPLQKRWTALSELKKSGIPVGVCVAPLLPTENVTAFARRIASVRPDVVVVEGFHDSQGRFGGDTGPNARKLLSEWHRRLAASGPDAAASYYPLAVTELGKHVALYEGERGFFPP